MSIAVSRNPGACQPLGKLTGPAADFQDRRPRAEPSGRGVELHDVRRVPFLNQAETAPGV